MWKYTNGLDLYNSFDIAIYVLYMLKSSMLKRHWTHQYTLNDLKNNSSIFIYLSSLFCEYVIRIIWLAQISLMGTHAVAQW